MVHATDTVPHNCLSIVPLDTQRTNRPTTHPTPHPCPRPSDAIPPSKIPTYIHSIARPNPLPSRTKASATRPSA